MSSYLTDAASDAQDAARYFQDEIIESFFDNDGEASDDLLNDYSDSYHHEHHVDKAYNLQEAAALLDELSDYEETDSGLWESLKPREAISAQAAYTYGNAVMSMFQTLIKQINEDAEIVELYEEYQGIEDIVQSEFEEAEETHQAEQEEAERLYDEANGDDAAPFEPAVFSEPFDVDDETEKRQEAIKKLITKRMDEVISNFDG